MVTALLRSGIREIERGVKEADFDLEFFILFLFIVFNFILSYLFILIWRVLEKGFNNTHLGWVLTIGKRIACW